MQVTGKEDARRLDIASKIDFTVEVQDHEAECQRNLPKSKLRYQQKHPPQYSINQEPNQSN